SRQGGRRSESRRGVRSVYSVSRLGDGHHQPDCWTDCREVRLFGAFSLRRRMCEHGVRTYSSPVSLGSAATPTMVTKGVRPLGSVKHRARFHNTTGKIARRQCKTVHISTGNVGWLSSLET